MKICTVLGARPQFIKAAAISRQISSKYKEQITEVIIHTGQHFDFNMSDIFFSELNIPQPKHYLDIHGGSHTNMISRMMLELEKTFLLEKPDAILVYGDTNSTLAGALVASQMGIQLIHVEAGLRSHNWQMPEERNRVLTDHMSDLLFCPTQRAVTHLQKEGVTKGVFFSGDVMLDMAKSVKINEEKIHSLTLGRPYVFMTIHRAENCANANTFNQVIDWIKADAKGKMIIWPIHPRAKQAIEKYHTDTSGMTLIEPLGYFDMISFLSMAELVYTDSGGVQKEAFFVNTPCITMRSETEWEETIENGMNKLWTESHIHQLNKASLAPFGSGNAAENILDKVIEYQSNQS